MIVVDYYVIIFLCKNRIKIFNSMFNNVYNFVVNSFIYIIMNYIFLCLNYGMLYFVLLIKRLIE